MAGARKQPLGAVAELTAAGMTVKDIAERLCLHPRTVWRYRVAAGVAKPKHPLITEAEDARIQDMLADGVPLTEIAKTIGKHPVTLYKRYPGMGAKSLGRYHNRLKNELGLGDV